MFNVSLDSKSFDSLKQVSSGITFGEFDKEIRFKVDLKDEDLEQDPLFVNLLVVMDSERDQYETEHTILENELCFKFYNPNVLGTSGLVKPVTIIKNEDYSLCFIFWIELMRDNIGVYRLTYEFLQETVDH